MRTSERIAAVAVTLMVLPAFLVAPICGIWWVIHVWPSLRTTQHLWFWISSGTLCVTLPYVFRNRLGVFWRGRMERLSPFEQVLVFAPIAICGWSVTGAWLVAVPFVLFLCLVWLERIDNAVEGRVERIDPSLLIDRKDFELPLIQRIRNWVIQRRQSRSRRQAITMGPKRRRGSRRYGGGS